MSQPAAPAPEAWHVNTSEDALARLNSSGLGLSSDEARQRLERTGPNVLKEGKRRSPLMMIADQFKDLLIVLLLISAAIAGVVGDPVEAYAILAIVILNGAIGFFQEFRAEKAMKALRSMAAPTAVAIRDGSPQSIAAADNNFPDDGAADV